MMAAKENQTIGLIKDDFPALSQLVHGRPVSFLDSAASAQKPRAVIDAMDTVLQEHYSNVHRGVYTFGARTTVAFEAARKKVADFLGAETDKEIVFTRNATEAINLVASTWGEKFLKAGDEVLITELEHHANIVPWYFLKEKKGIILKSVPVLENGALDMEAFDKLLTDKTKLVAFTQMSNVLGTLTSVKEIISKAKAVGAVTLVDGSQGIVHQATNVQDLGCDFYIFTGHKLYGPSGVGVLYGRYDLLDTMPPYQGGGEMIDEVYLDNITFKGPPYRFEAGTPAITEIIGLGAAVDYVRDRLDYNVIAAEETKMLHAAEERLSAIEGLKIYSNAPDRASIVSFTMENVHPHDIATVFDQVGLAVRAGHHCCQPLMRALKVNATVRASFAAYNTMDDVDRLIEGVEKVRKIFK